MKHMLAANARWSTPPAVTLHRCLSRDLDGIAPRSPRLWVLVIAYGDLLTDGKVIFNSLRRHYAVKLL